MIKAKILSQRLVYAVVTLSLVCSTVQAGARISQSKRWLIPMAGVVGASTAVFLNEYNKEVQEEVPMQWAISGGCTAVIEKVLVPTFCIPTCKWLMSEVQKTRIGNYLGFDRCIDMHKFMGAFLGTLALVHGGCSTNSLGSWEGNTGLAMLALIGGPAIGSYLLKDSPSLRNKFNYQQRFLTPHRVGAGFLALYAVHRPSLELVPSALAALAELALGSIVEKKKYTYDTEVIDARVEGDKIVLSVVRPAEVKVEEGQFAYLQFQGRYHPFTIAQFDNDKLHFVIAPVGDDTNELKKMIQESRLVPHAISKLVGPFYSPFQNLPQDTPLIAISSGGGMSVSLATLQWLEKSTEKNPVMLIHSEREAKSFLPLVEAVARARDNGVKISEVHLFHTGKELDLERGSFGALREEIERLGMKWVRGESGRYQDPRASSYQDMESYLNPSPIEVVFHSVGRLDLGKALEDKRLPLDWFSNPNVHVLVSGQISEGVRDYCNENNLPITEERFNF